MFNEVLKDLRKSKGLSQEQLATATGVSVHTINSYESGRREPSSKNLQIFEDYFSVSRGFLLGEINPEIFYNDQNKINANLDMVFEQLNILKKSMKISESDQNRKATIFLLNSLYFINKNILCENGRKYEDNDLDTLFLLLSKFNSAGIKEVIKRVDEMTLVSNYCNNS